MKQPKTVTALLALALTTFMVFGTACSRGKDAAASLPIQNLRTLAKLYGYLRYFHPSDEAARVDWDKLAIYAAAKVGGAPDSKSLKAALEEVFGPVAPAMVLYFKGEQPPASPSPSSAKDANLKLVSWQHYGLGSDNPNSVYKSIRLNRPQETRGNASLNQGIDASKLGGRTVTLTAWAKALPGDRISQARLWLQVVSPSGPAFSDNMRDRPIRSPEWQEYSITGPIAADAQSIVFGAIISGRGRFLIDGFRLSTTDSSGKSTPLLLLNGGLEESNADGTPKSWEIHSQDLDVRLRADDVREGQHALEIASKVEPFAAPIFMKLAPADGVIEKEIGRVIVCRIPLTLRSDENGTLPRSDSKDLDRLRAALDALSPSSLTARDERVRQGDVIIGWNVFQHFYPYFDTIKIDWDRVLIQTLERAGSDRTEEEFLRTLNWMVARLQDGHGGVYNNILLNKTGWPPFQVEWVGSRAVIVSSRDASFRRGDIVLSLNGKDAADILREEEEYLSGSPQWKRVRSTSLFGSGAVGIRSWMKIERGGRIIEASFERSIKVPSADPPTRPAIDDLGRGVSYVDLRRASWQEINARIKELAAARGIVFDLRGYPNGNHLILMHLLRAADTSSAWMKIPLVVLPDGKDWSFQEIGWNLPTASPHIGGKVVFLTDGRAISYAESFMGFVEHYKLGEIIGEPTAGANGNVNTFTLPGGFTVAWTGMKVVKHDGSQHHTIGILPTIPFHRTIAGVAAGKDECLDKALAIINK